MDKVGSHNHDRRWTAAEILAVDDLGYSQVLVW